MNTNNPYPTLSRKYQQKLRMLTTIVAGGALLAFSGCGDRDEEEYTATTTDTTVASTATYPTADRTADTTASATTATNEDAWDANQTTQTQTAQAQQQKQSEADQQIVLHEEEVDVSKRQVDAGGVVVKTDVVTEQVERPVELRREQVEITRVSPEEADARAQEGEAFQEDEIYIPLTREEAVVQKDVEARQVLEIDKQAQTEQKQIDATVRREVADIQSQGNTSTTERFASDSSQQNQQSSTSMSDQQSASSSSNQQDLAQRIREDLRNSEEIALSEQELNGLQIQIENNTVTLAGTVPNEQVSRQIEMHVSQMDGVQSVENELEPADTGAVAE